MNIENLRRRVLRLTNPEGNQSTAIIVSIDGNGTINIGDKYWTDWKAAISFIHAFIQSFDGEVTVIVNSLELRLNNPPLEKEWNAFYKANL